MAEISRVSRETSIERISWLVNLKEAKQGILREKTGEETTMELKKFDVIDFLDSDEALVEYLNAALAENDPKYFAKALGNVARAKGMSSISEASGVGRQSLYRALSEDGNPRIDTLFKILEALNIRLAITASG